MFNIVQLHHQPTLILRHGRYRPGGFPALVAPGAVRGRRALRGRARAAIVRGPAAAIATGLLRGHGKLGTAGGILGHKNCRGF